MLQANAKNARSINALIVEAKKRNVLNVSLPLSWIQKEMNVDAHKEPFLITEYALLAQFKIVFCVPIHTSITVISVKLISPWNKPNMKALMQQAKL